MSLNAGLGLLNTMQAVAMNSEPFQSTTSSRARPCVWRPLFMLLVLAAVCSGPLTASQRDDTHSKWKSREAKIKQVLSRVTSATVAFADGSGSAVVVSEDGLVLTAAHIRRSDQEHGVRLVFGDGRKVPARWLASNHRSDLGMLRITEHGRWPFASLGNAVSLKRGDWCLALGHPSGYSPERRLPVVRLGRILHNNLIRLVTDCALRSGDSGGPTFDLSGRLIGIHSQTGNCVTDNWDISVACMRRDWRNLSQGQSRDAIALSKSLHRRALGVALSPKDNLHAQIETVDGGSPAAAAGLLKGDVVVAVDGERITHHDHFLNLIEDRWSGEPVRLRVARGQSQLSLRATLRRIDSPLDARIQAGSSRGWTESDTRSRRAGCYEKQAASNLQLCTGLIESSKAGLVGVKVNGEIVAQGLFVDHGGTVATKASELTGASSIKCLLSNGVEHPARLLAKDDAHDVALLRLDGATSSPLPFASTSAQVGDIVFAADHTGKAIAMGIVGSPPRSLVARGHLGVAIQEQTSTVLITSVTKDSTAAVAGLQIGDVLVSVGDVPVTDGASLAVAIGKIKPGVQTRMEFFRDGVAHSTRAIMKPLDVPEWYRPQEIRSGAVLSQRLTGFPSALQHDIPLLPEHCGGPLLNLDGQAVGLNVARQGRVESFAVPSDTLRSLIADLLRTVATK